MRGFWLESLNMSFNWKYHPNLIHLHDFQLLVLLPFVIEIAFFFQESKFAVSKTKFRQAFNRCKRVFDSTKHFCSNKKRSLTLPRNLIFVNSVKVKYPLKVNLLFFLRVTIRVKVTV